ncbi:MAG TPA: hypothetical protein VNA69_11935 [Thermoanaerobaculia bacterium]|nr:hypothetical protein [Thermoanaerobaculia bacterium]
MLSLILAATVVTSLHPLREIAMDAGTNIPQLAYARDDRFEYLGTPRGLYRSERIASAPLEVIAWSGESVNALAVDDDGALYLSKGLENFALWPEHTLVRSRDRGVTFENVDAGLFSCIVPSECGYLVPRRITFAPDRIFASAGGNVVVTADDGATWNVLAGATSDGKPAAQTCPAIHERIGERLLFGGECPLDFGYLALGTLRPDLLGWSAGPVRLTAPEMENRNVQFIRDAGNGVVFAGVEGALLKSTDGGESFRYVIHFDLEATRYPYISQFVITPRIVVAGGFDKAKEVAYLAYSADRGESWIDLSAHVANASMVSMLAEDGDGRVLVATFEGEKFVISELVLARLGRRRSVR